MKDGTLLANNSRLITARYSLRRTKAGEILSDLRILTIQPHVQVQLND